MKYVFKFLLFVSTGVSCHKTCNYPHLNELQNYLTNELGYSFQSNETILIILPLDAWNACLRKTITLLKESERVWMLLFVVRASHNQKSTHTSFVRRK